MKAPGPVSTHVSVEAVLGGWIIRLSGDSNKVWTAQTAEELLAALEHAGVVAEKDD